MCYTPFILRREKNISKEFIATVDEIREAYNDAWYDTDIEHINYALQKMLSDKLLCVNNVLIFVRKIVCYRL